MEINVAKYGWVKKKEQEWRTMTIKGGELVILGL